MSGTNAELDALIDAITVERSSTIFRLAGHVWLLYYYALTFHEEVSKIWPQRTLKLGKLLYLALRYLNISAIIMEFVAGFPTFAHISVSTCGQVYKAWWGLVLSCNVFAEAIFWICLFALLEGKQRYFYLLVAGFLAFLIPIVVLQAIYIAPWHAVPVPELLVGLGSPCYFGTTKPELAPLYSAAAYIGFARSTLVMVVAISTLIFRYRRRRSTLLNAIIREGGMYYISAFVLHFFTGLTSSVNTGIKDKYQIVTTLRAVLIPIFADRLLLTMQRIATPETQHIVSTLMFDHGADYDDGGDTVDVADVKASLEYYDLEGMKAGASATHMDRDSREGRTGVIGHGNEESLGITEEVRSSRTGVA